MDPVDDHLAALTPAGRGATAAGARLRSGAAHTTFSSRCDTVVDNEWTVLDAAVNVDVGCVSHFNLVSDRAVFDRVRQAVTG
ncbi:hypothetical protein [Actinophytocola glycyrrhizae]|uniref:Uncharacterized protein n=1 Tax=Actinophytocola glycyrrhizae TaxID=2044873 RepID=A0ABV9RVD8_9PSEU